MSVLAEYYHAPALGAQAKAGADDQAANLARQQAGQVGANAESTRALQAAQAQGLGAGAAKTAAETSQVAPNAAATRAGIGADAALTAARTTSVPYQNAATAAGTAGQNISNEIAGYGLPGFAQTDPDTGSSVKPQGFETGGRVLSKHEAAIGKSKKPGPTDTVPVMLTPGEGVLNKGAMHHFGTDVVDHMNKIGLLRMGAQSEVAKALGQPDPHAPPQTAKRAERKAKQGKAKAA